MGKRKISSAAAKKPAAVVKSKALPPMPTRKAPPMPKAASGPAGNQRVQKTGVGGITHQSFLPLSSTFHAAVQYGSVHVRAAQRVQIAPQREHRLHAERQRLYRRTQANGTGTTHKHCEWRCRHSTHLCHDALRRGDGRRVRPRAMSAHYRLWVRWPAGGRTTGGVSRKNGVCVPCA